jgi:hypothetical protein
MKLILHIGTGERGTTAPQQFLCSNAKDPREQGVYYATPPNEINFNAVVILSCCQDWMKRLSVLSWLLDFARSNGIRRLLPETRSRFQ